MVIVHYHPNLQIHYCYFRRKLSQNDAKKKLCCKYKLLWICHSSIYLSHYKNAIFVCRNPTYEVNSWNILNFFIHSVAGTFPLSLLIWQQCCFCADHIPKPSRFKAPGSCQARSNRHQEENLPSTCRLALGQISEMQQVSVKLFNTWA